MKRKLLCLIMTVAFCVGLAMPVHGETLEFNVIPSVSVEIADTDGLLATFSNVFNYYISSSGDKENRFVFE